MKEAIADLSFFTGMSRRWFLKALGTAGGVGLGLTAAPHVIEWLADQPRRDETFKIYFDRDHERLSLDEAFAFAERMDWLNDALPPYQPSTTPEDIENWVREIVPFFAYNGVSDGSRFPTEADYVDYREGRMHNHVGGQSDCQNYVKLNARLNNPHSAWYRHRMFLPILVHELAHVQQGETICNDYRNQNNIETSAQIVTLEVLANMANKSNKEAVYGLVDELSGLAFDTAYSITLREGKEDEFLTWSKSVVPSAFEQSRLAAAQRYWSSMKGDLKALLEEYSERPLNMIIRAHFTGNDQIEGLAIPGRHVGENPFRYSPNALPFKLDDLMYFLVNAEALVEEV